MRVVPEGYHLLDMGSSNGVYVLGQKIDDAIIREGDVFSMGDVFVRILPGGLFSTYVTDEAAIGNRLLVHGPQGAFGLHEHGLRPRWFVGGGTGVAPLLSMLRRMAEWGDAQPARLYLGCNTEADVFATAEIEALGGALPDFHHEICVWRPETDSSWAGFVGTPVDALERDLAATEELPDVYVCGPPAMVDAVERAMRAAGVPDEHLIVERFAANVLLNTSSL